MARTINQVLIGLTAFAATSFVALALASASDAAPRVTSRAASERAVPADALPPVLETVRPGLWTVKGEGLAPQRLCVGDPADLVQLRHAGAACRRMIVSAGPHVATVQYSCAAAGWGRTALTVDSPEVVRIDSQGIADNAPFAYRAEARREGACTAASS